MNGDGIDIYWLPLGAGGRFVRLNGRIYETILARRAGRPACALFHCALEVHSGGERFVVEMAPVWNEKAPDRGVVQEGPVAARWLGRFRAFRYEVRCWREGRIPDVAEAAADSHRVSGDPDAAARLLDTVGSVPAFTWGRDVLHCGDMWNSNSLVSWLLARTEVGPVRPPAGGRAPGWATGLELAARQAGRDHAEHPDTGDEMTRASE